MIDIEALRQYLITHFGTLAQNYPAAYTKVEEVMNANPYQLIDIAQEELTEDELAQFVVDEQIL